MWRLLLVPALLPMLVACSGGGGDDTLTEDCVFGTPPTPSFFAETVPVMSLDEARERVSYDFKTLSELPDGVELLGVTARGNAFCPNWANPPVEVYYEGAGHTILLNQHKGGAPDHYATPVQINGADGKLSFGEADSRGPYMIVSWAQDGIGISAIGFLNETLTEERFLAILESIE